MSHPANGNETTVSSRTMELIVAAAFMGVAALVMYDSWRIGARWGSDGPEAGYFPFYVGLIMFVASAATFGINLFAVSASSNFVGRSELKQVLQVLIPTIVFVVAIGYLGLYVAGAIFIAYFMVVLGKYPVWKVVPIAILVPGVLFMMFEVWFLVPLPKGPLEAAFGY
ncbi:tripartite tricarboxylate transporter TctB family protein [Prosthecomicrobium sp. N25]|uniref:tripartite tricarboxylate transporter TctB family protein n=1 Tax=Prosthecomicrobium sp. N25 TaxID=3129254 RepID=UPI0030788ABB